MTHPSHDGPDPADLPDAQSLSSPSRSPLEALGLQPGEVLVTAHEDEAKWAVPLGVRTASEWAWRAIVITIALGGVSMGISRLSEIVIPVVIALLLAAMLYPLKHQLTRWMPSQLASGLTVLGTLTVIIGMLSFVGSQFAEQFPQIQIQVGRGYDQVREWMRSGLNISDTQLEQWFEQARAQASSYTGDLGKAAASAGLTATHVVVGFFLAMFTLFFFLHDGAIIWRWIVRLFPSGSRAKVHSSGVIAWGQLSAFTRATIIVAAADALGTALIAGVLGVPFVSGIAVLVFFGAFVPIIGAFLSGGVAVLLALVALGPIQALLMLGGITLVMQLESHVLQPLLLGRAVRVHPLSVILAIAAGLILAGIVGALVAVPIVAVLNAVGHHLLESPAPAAADVTAAEHSPSPD